MGDSSPLSRVDIAPSSNYTRTTMDVYLSKNGLARSLGIHPNNLRPPKPDVIIGKRRGWLHAYARDGTFYERLDAPLRLMSAQEVARRLKLNRHRVKKLRDADHGLFPAPVACIEFGDPERTLPTRGWDGRVYGWDPAAITTFQRTTGRKGDAQKGRRGRPPGKGNYADLPRCLRPRTESVHGDGKPCQAVRRKIDGQWAPACGIHLTDQERHILGITSSATSTPATSAQAEGPPA